MKPLFLVVCAAILHLGAAAQIAVVLSDDFEVSSGESPPKGWAMWGAQEFKLPANYTCQTLQPHAGAGCFRIYHPANTRGYIVSAPERAVRPQAGKVYSVSFWARAENPGQALFQWTAYRGIKPFVDAPSPGSLPFTVGKEWAKFTYSIREGLDFFADESRFLLLSFTATSDPKAEQTLWIDDVSVSEAPDPNPPGLLNPATIAHGRLEHRLRSGERLEFTLNPAKRLRRANAEIGGVSFHRVCGWTGQPYNRKGEYTLASELEKAIADLRLPMTRVYGVGDEPFSVESSLDKVAELCRRVAVPQERCVLELEEQGAERKLPPEVWRRAVSFAARQGYRFRYWEVANEPYSALWGHGGAFPTPETFISHFKSVSDAIRQEDPRAQIGMDIYPEQVRWGNYLLKELAGRYDFVAPHYYCGANVHKLPFEDVVLAENYRMLDRALRVEALLRAYNPARDVTQHDTEWGMIAGTPEGKDADFEDRNANIIGTLHRAVRLVYYARENILHGASGWQMLSRTNAQGFGILSQEAPDKRFMLYWLYYYFNRHLGEWALRTDGTAPFYRSESEFGGPLTPVLATLSRDERTVFLVVVNGSWTRSVPCRVTLENFKPAAGSAVMISSGNLDGKPLLERKSDAVADLPVNLSGDKAALTLPPHSVAFVRLEM